MGVISRNVGDEITIVIPVISLLIAGWPLDGGYEVKTHGFH